MQLPERLCGVLRIETAREKIRALDVFQKAPVKDPALTLAAVEENVV